MCTGARTFEENHKSTKSQQCVTHFWAPRSPVPKYAYLYTCTRNTSAARVRAPIIGGRDEGNK